MSGVFRWSRGGFGLTLEPRYVAIGPPSLGFSSSRHGDLQGFRLFLKTFPSSYSLKFYMNG